MRCKFKKINGEIYKRCSHCKKYLPISCFRTRKEKGCGYRSECKACQKIYIESIKDKIVEYDKRRYLRLKNKIRKKYLLNRKTILAKKKANYCPELERQNNIKRRDKRKAYRRRPEVRKAVRKRYKELYHSSLQFKLKANLRSRIYNLVRKNKTSKNFYQSMELLGCSIPHLKKHLKSKFKKGMSWKVFMKGNIHIDHVRPCASFDLTKEDQQKQCFHWTNLQPLWALDNLSKGSKWSNLQNDSKTAISRNLTKNVEI